MLQDLLSIETSNRHLVARKNELAILKMVRDFGYVRREEIQRAVWPRSSLGVAKKMSYRTVTRLIEKQYLKDRKTLLNSRCVILTNQGAEHLRNWGIEAEAGYALNPEGSQFTHRTLGTQYLISKLLLGQQAYGEYAINQGYGPLNRQDLGRRFKKIPDGLVIEPSSEREGNHALAYCADWVEIENANKSPAELWKIFDVAWTIGCAMDEKETIQLDRLVFVFDSMMSHAKVIRDELVRYAKQHQLPQEKLLSSIVLASCRFRYPLTLQGIQEANCQDLLGLIHLDGAK